jgi:hypothetical protein
MCGTLGFVRPISDASNCAPQVFLPVAVIHY